MCDYSGKLVAWIDGELIGDQMIDLQRHSEECGECRTYLAKYQQVSKTFDEYCLAVTTLNTRSRKSSLVAALRAVASVALAASLAMVWLGPRFVSPRDSMPPTVATVPAAHVETPPAPSETVHRHHAVPHRNAQTTSSLRPEALSLPGEPAIQIAIPAESMFPPGSVPEGVSFTADVSVGPDGLARQVRLQPHLAGFRGRIQQ
jgi:hypothetical protein